MNWRDYNLWNFGHFSLILLRLNVENQSNLLITSINDKGDGLETHKVKLGLGRRQLRWANHIGNALKVN